MNFLYDDNRFSKLAKNRKKRILKPEPEGKFSELSEFFEILARVQNSKTFKIQISQSEK